MYLCHIMNSTQILVLWFLVCNDWLQKAGFYTHFRNFCRTERRTFFFTSESHKKRWKQSVIWKWKWVRRKMYHKYIPEQGRPRHSLVSTSGVIMKDHLPSRSQCTFFSQAERQRQSLISCSLFQYKAEWLCGNNCNLSQHPHVSLALMCITFTALHDRHRFICSLTF